MPFSDPTTAVLILTLAHAFNLTCNKMNDPRSWVMQHYKLHTSKYKYRHAHGSKKDLGPDSEQLGYISSTPYARVRLEELLR